MAALEQRLEQLVKTLSGQLASERIHMTMAELGAPSAAPITGSMISDVIEQILDQIQKLLELRGRRLVGVSVRRPRRQSYRWDARLSEVGLLLATPPRKLHKILDGAVRRLSPKSAESAVFKSGRCRDWTEGQESLLRMNHRPGGKRQPSHRAKTTTRKTLLRRGRGAPIPCLPIGWEEPRSVFSLAADLRYLSLSQVASQRRPSGRVRRCQERNSAR